MRKNLTPLILIILAIGIYFSFTRVKFEEIKAVRAVNAIYQQALDNSEKLVKERDAVLADYNKIDIADRENLEKMLPDNIDNVRLIIDTNAVAARHGLVVKNIKTSAAGMETADAQQNRAVVTSAPDATAKPYNVMTLTFNVTSNYQAFIDFLKDLEASLRIMDVSKLTLTVAESGAYDYTVEIKTYWLKQ